MPQFEIETLELHSYKVTYVIDAESRDEAVKQVVCGDVDYESKSLCDVPLHNPSDEVQLIHRINGDPVDEKENARLLATAKES